MKVFGHPLSSCTRKVLMTLAEKNQSADFTLVDLFIGEHKTSGHLAKHPFGVIPVLDDGGFVLFESRAILRYLDERFASPSLTPQGAKERARMNQWLSVDQSYVAPFTRALAIERILKPHDGKTPDAEIEKYAEISLQNALRVIDRSLTKTPYLAGEAFSLADISLAPYVASLALLKAEHLTRDLPSLTAWSARVFARPSWKRAT